MRKAQLAALAQASRVEISIIITGGWSVNAVVSKYGTDQFSSTKPGATLCVNILMDVG